MIKITLTRPELEIAEVIGTLRYETSKIDKIGVYGAMNNIIGARGEEAVAKWKGVYWGGDIMTYHLPDVAGKYQVRTRTKDYYEMIVHEDDADNDIFILVIDHAPIMNIVGWLLGKECKKKEWIETHGGYRPAFFVPQAVLNPLETLP